MFLVDSLARYPERFGDQWPAPAGPHRLLDCDVFHPIGQATQRRYCSEPIGGLAQRLNLVIRHVSNRS
jgi:hypothetical protein